MSQKHFINECTITLSLRKKFGWNGENIVDKILLNHFNKGNWKLLDRAKTFSSELYQSEELRRKCKEASQSQERRIASSVDC